jgi:GT2 family glycosyltransferase
VNSLSIIIPSFEPTYAESSLLTRTLESLAATTFLPEATEVIIVDGGSSIGTRQWLAGYAGFPAPLSVVCLSKNFGFTRHINIGLHIAQAETVVLANSDLEFDPGWWLAMQTALMDDPQVGIVGCQVRDMVDRQQIVHGGAIGPAKHKLGFADQGDWQERTFDDDYLTFACVAIRRKVFGDIGPLDEQFIIHCSDSDFCYRAREAGWKLCYEPKAIVYHEQEGTLRHMRGVQLIEETIRQDQERFHAKWAAHLSLLAHPCESVSPEAEPISQSTSTNLDESGDSAPSQSTPTSG